MARLARHHNVAIALSHSSAWPYTEEITAGFVYVRLHGPRELYGSAYTEPELEDWAERISAWSRGSEPDDARAGMSTSTSTTTPVVTPHAMHRL
jgi:uncharacterized protein YecE (DUF72 family)